MHKDGLIALKNFLDKLEIQVPTTATLIHLAELVLATNTFFFSGEAYIQTSGVAMGSNWAQPVLASSLDIKKNLFHKVLMVPCLAF